MDVVRCLGGAPECQLVVGIKVSDRSVLLEWQMSIAFVEKSIFANQIGFGETFFDISEL